VARKQGDDGWQMREPWGSLRKGRKQCEKCMPTLGTVHGHDELEKCVFGGKLSTLWHTTPRTLSSTQRTGAGTGPHVIAQSGAARQVRRVELPDLGWRAGSDVRISPITLAPRGTPLGLLFARCKRAVTSWVGGCDAPRPASGPRCGAPRLGCRLQVASAL
jgi:hypothetical protein